MILIVGMTMFETVRENWPNYVIEAWCLGTFMISACSFGVLLFHPESPLSVIDTFLRMVLMGIAMGATAILIICSGWGKRSGAHFNPAVTLAFLRLRKISAIDAVLYMAGQFVGGVAGVALAWLVFGRLLANGTVNFVVTIPGDHGVGAAFVAEVIISFFMMTMILFSSNNPRISHLTPYFAGTLLMFYIAFESPISGMSMNPARSLASSVVSGDWTAWWIYFVGPTVAMLAAAELFVRTQGLKAVICAKLNHNGPAKCIFNCGYMAGEIS